MDVPVILQLKFLHSYENVEVPQFPFLDRVLQLPVVLQRRKAWSSSTLFTCPLLCVRQLPEMVQTVSEMREVSARVLGQGCLAR